MSHKHYRGPSIPDVGDEPILESIEAMMDTAVVSTPAASIDTAALAIATAVAAGADVSSANPMKFLIGQNEYVANGEKIDGKYYLRPVNEVEFSEVALTADVEVARNGTGLYNRLVTASLNVRDYDRVAFAWGVGTGNVTSGRFNLTVRMNGTKDGQLARWDTADDVNTVTTINLARIPAGTDPDINLSTMSAGAGFNQMNLAKADNMTKLVVLAFPITMA